MDIRDEFEALYSKLANANIDIIRQNRTGDTYFNGSKLDRINIAYAVFMSAKEKQEVDHEMQD